MIVVFNKKYTAREQDNIIDSMIINIDSREQKIKHITDIYDKQNVKYQIGKMDFGDYTFIVPANEELDIKEDILFHNLVSVERKSGINEVCVNITKGRKQFQAEYERHKGLMILMIEKDGYDDICNKNYRSKVSNKSLLGTLHKWQHQYDVPFIFVNSTYSAVYIYQTFKYYLKYCFDKYPM